MLLSFKYHSVFIYSETSRNYELIIVQFSGPFLYIILTIQTLTMLHSSELISISTISMFVSGNIQKVISRYVYDMTVIISY
jgi:hypothetical protein